MENKTKKKTLNSQSYIQDYGVPALFLIVYAPFTFLQQMGDERARPLYINTDDGKKAVNHITQ